MPNWIEGTIKLRGAKDDVLSFVKEKLKAYPNTWEDNPEPLPHEEWGFEIDDRWAPDCYEVSWNAEYQPHIDGSRRAFITSNQAYIEPTGEEFIVVFDIKQAWAFTPDDTDTSRWEKLSRDCNIDIRLYGLECNMQFGEEIEIIKGKTTMCNVFGYTDYNWECPFPLMGG